MNQNQVNDYPTKYWIDPCTEARHIRRRFGLDDALQIIIGRELPLLIRLSERNEAHKAELLAFIAEIHRLFTDEEIRKYFGNREVSLFRELLLPIP